jgi:hypothetical protein
MIESVKKAVLSTQDPELSGFPNRIHRNMYYKSGIHSFGSVSDLEKEKQWSKFIGNKPLLELCIVHCSFDI